MFSEASLENFKKWAKELDTEQTCPMSETTAYLMMNLLMGSKLSKEAKEDFLFRIIDKRIQVMHSYLMDDEAKAIIATVCDSPGEAVIYCNYLQWKSDTENLPIITLNDLCMKIFPFGFFTHKSLKKAWDNQKIKGDNMLDIIKFK